MQYQKQFVEIYFFNDIFAFRFHSLAATVTRNLQIKNVVTSQRRYLVRYENFTTFLSQGIL